MTQLRAQLPPTGVRAAWACGLIAGAAALTLGASTTLTAQAQDPAVTGPSGQREVAPPSTPGPPVQRTAGLLPTTLSSSLQSVLPTGAQGARVSGAYGSGHRGSWQFTAYLTWTDADGTPAGGRVDLPAAGDTAPTDTGLTPQRLREEQAIGWTFTQLDRASARVDQQARLAMLELEIQPDGTASYVTCAAGAPKDGRCTRSDGMTSTTFASRLADDPAAGALAVTYG